jgi:hypothetical protein
MAVAAFALAACAEAPLLAPAPTEAAVGSPAMTGQAAAVANAPVVATFSKTFQGLEDNTLVWTGTLTLGETTGTLRSSIDLTLPGTREAGATLHGTVLWEVSGDLELVIVTEGIANFAKGIVRTNGRVESGPYEGARVHQQGDLDGDLNAEGFLRIHPGTAP